MIFEFGFEILDCQRKFDLSATVYRTADRKAAYVRQTGFSNIQQEQMVLSYIEKHGTTRNVYYSRA